MASELLMSISQDERERAIFRSRRIYQSDLESNMLTAKREGRAEGVIAIARNMVSDGESIDRIIRYTGLTLAEIEKLRGAD